MAIQRSSDFALANNWNVLTASFLTILISQQTGLLPGTVFHVIGNCHLYENHTENAKLQTTRVPYPYPVVTINKQDIDNYSWKDVNILGYTHHPKLDYPMAV